MIKAGNKAGNHVLISLFSSAKVEEKKRNYGRGVFALTTTTEKFQTMLEVEIDENKVEVAR